MSKEKLKELKEKYRKCRLNRGISIFSFKDIEWFIKRSERARELEDSLDSIKQSVTARVNNALREENNE